MITEVENVSRMTPFAEETGCRVFIAHVSTAKAVALVAEERSRGVDKAFAIIVDNPYITVFVSAFIVLGVIAVNMVANIIPPTYVITLLTKLKYKIAVVITGLLALCSFPWVLVQDSSARGLGMFILIYSAFLGPIVSILLVEYYILRKQKINVDDLYKEDGPFTSYNPCALIAMLVGAGTAFLKVELSWIIGFVVAGIAYLLLTKFAFKDSKFKRNTIFEK